METYWSGDVPCILDLDTRRRWVVSFMPQLLYPWGKSPYYPLDRRLGGPQSQSGCDGEEKNSQFPPGIEPPITNYPAWTELPGYSSHFIYRKCLLVLTFKFLHHIMINGMEIILVYLLTVPLMYEVWLWCSRIEFIATIPVYLPTAYWEGSPLKYSPWAAMHLTQQCCHCWKHFWNSCCRIAFMASSHFVRCLQYSEIWSL